MTACNMKWLMPLTLGLFIGIGITITYGERIRFTEAVYSASVHETTLNTPRPSSSLLNVTCTQTVNNSTNNVIYQLISNDTTFIINNETGELFVAMDLDYEAITSYHLVVQCFSTLNSSWSGEALINITVLPVNEYRPVVSRTTESELIFETTPLGTVIISTLPGGRITYSAYDEDAGPDGNIYYSVVTTTDNETFAFNSSVGALYLAREFDLDADRVTLRRENVQITACDSSPPTPDCLNIDITLLLLTGNDNAPQFATSSVYVSYPETVNLTTTIAQVECSDDDFVTGALNGYEIISVSPSQTPTGTFQISRMGTISLGLTLDFELTSVYILQVRCFDSGPSVMDDVATVTVNISAVNDNTPKFVNSTLNVSHPESVPPSTLIAQVVCADEDIIVGELSGYELVSVNPALTPLGTFSINSTTGAIETQLPLDFEFTEMYELQVRCFDSGSPVMEDFVNVTVSLQPVNDNTPRFQNTTVTVLHPESVNVTTEIARVECSDQDLSTGALAGYELVSISPLQTPQGTFSINEEGTVLLDLPLDFEFSHVYELRVRCFDSGLPVMNDSAIVRVNLYDINDNAPVCYQVPDQSLSTQTYSHETLVTLNCTDTDSGENGELRYSFSQAPSLTSGEFLLNPLTGQITVLGVLSDNGNYTFHVLVSDLGTPSLSTTIKFEVSIQGDVPSSTPLTALPLWAIIVIVVVGLLLVGCVLISGMCCYYSCCFKNRRDKKDFTSEVISAEDNDSGLVFAQYGNSLEPESDIDETLNYKDYVLHFKTTASENSSAIPTTPTSISSDSDNGVIYTTSTEFILNPSAQEEDEVIPPDRNHSPPEVTVTVETSDIGLRTPGMDHSRDMLIPSEEGEDEDEEETGM